MEQPLSKTPWPRLPGYKVRELVGTGAKAHIYLGEDPDGNVVAVKHVVPAHKADDSAIRQVVTEHETASKLNHPNLRRSYSIHFRKKWMRIQEVILVMEFVDGRPLTEYAKTCGLVELVDKFIQVAKGLRAMHQSGLVHADLKHINILVRRDGGVKIIDFGQSCPVGTAKQKIQGTPDFIPPEQVHLRPLDPRCDVFSLGATMYYLLTGHPLKTEMNKHLTEQHAVAQVSRKPTTDPIWEDLDLPVGLTRLIEECCQPEREDRPADMATVIARLELIHASLTREPKKVDESAETWYPQHEFDI
ncbi:MAG: serine/threonine protein kinase [Phycisphaerales bacterium]|nr:MAG: serine/threonine protein kinase [Phycisphaerales bacterium]